MVPSLISICRIPWWCSGFSRFLLEIPFLDKFGAKNQKCQCKRKFGTGSNLKMQSSMVMSTFFIFDRKYLSWANLVQKMNAVSLSWNLVPRIFRKYLRQTLGIYEIGHYGKSSISIFQEIFANTGKIFISEGRLSTGQ